MTWRAIAGAGLIALFGAASSRAADQIVVQACFSPQTKCSVHILREIQLAQRELLVAVYAFTSEELAQALAQAKKRGVTVLVVLDREFDVANANSKGRFFEAAKIPVRRISGLRAKTPQKEAGLMHQKFAVIDRRVVFTGSYNWTYSADTLNDENLLMFRDAGPLADEYRRAFFRLWERPS